MSENSGARKVTWRELLDIREEQWRPLLRGVSLVAEAEIPEARREQVALALGAFYGKYKAGTGSGVAVLDKWRACLVAAMTGVAVTSFAQGAYWPAFWAAVRYEADSNDQHVWGDAFARAASRLGLPTFPDSTQRYVGPILMHAGIPAYCLGDFFELLVERRRRDPGLDADGFLAWATAPGRKHHLSALDKPAERFLLGGGDYAHDVVDRTFDLFDRLTEPDPDLDGVRLPRYMIESARRMLDHGELDLTGTRTSGHRGGATRRQAQPRIALDPYGQGVHVLLPAVGDTPDGVAHWRVTAGGETRTVQSRAMWVGAAEAAPPTACPLSRPVRTVLVSLAGREDLTTELRVVEQTDPVLFFSEDGRRLTDTMSLPRTQVWIMHPADRELHFTGHPGQMVEPAVPFGWDHWRLRLVALENVQAVGLQGGRSHAVEAQARPRLLLGEPIPGAATPYGSPVYSVPPRLLLPEGTGSEINWHAEIRRVGGSMPLVSRVVNPQTEIDIWGGVPRPVLGAFEITVRGPLGRGMRRTIFIAEGLSVGYEPKVRLLTGIGLTKGRAELAAAPGATAQPASLRFEPGERAKPIEYRTADESEPLVITPPHVAVLCPGAGITTWSTAPLHLVTETFAEAGRLLIRVPVSGEASRASQPNQLELAVHVNKQQVQVIPSSGQQSLGLAGYELARAADTVAANGRAELVVDLGDVVMPVAYVRPSRLASGVDLVGDQLVLREPTVVEGLMAGVYLAYAPWRTPVELTVSADGTVELPEELTAAGPLRVLLRIDDPWTLSDWPTWPRPGPTAYDCQAAGAPTSADKEEENLSRFVAGEDGLPELTEHLGWLWRLVGLCREVVQAGARADLGERCISELCRKPRAALLALAAEGLSQADVVHALIATGVAAVPAESAAWSPDELRTLGRIWAAQPAAAAIATGDLFAHAEIADAAATQCGDSLLPILTGSPDPHAAVGRFGPGTERMAMWQPEQVEAMWQAAAVVPKAMLDADTRTAAALKMFNARGNAPMRAAVPYAKSIIAVSERLLQQSRHPQLADAIAARRPDGVSRWLALPTMSIAMALVARLGARGNASCAALEIEYRGTWSNLALDAPDLVAIDLVLAEALVIGTLTDNPEGSHG